MTQCSVFLLTTIMLPNLHHFSQSRVFTIWGRGSWGGFSGLLRPIELQQVPNPMEPSVPACECGHHRSPHRVGVKIQEGVHMQVLGKRESSVQTRALLRMPPSRWDLSKEVPETQRNKAPGSFGPRDTTLGWTQRPWVCFQSHSASSSPKPVGPKVLASPL